MVPLSPRILLLVLVTLSFSPAFARTWHITADGTGDAPTIAAAMDSCAAGDSVLVQPGTYLEHDVPMADQITLRGATGDASVVTIDALGLGRVLLCQDIGGRAQVECLTLQGGVAPDGPLPESLGGGILCVDASPAITNCVIRDCGARFGAGVGITRGAPTLVRCSFRANEATHSFWAAGGGAYVHESSAVLRDCLFEENTAFSVGLPGDGGGLFCNATFARVEGCVFRNNRTGAGGGALYSYGSDEAQVTGCVFEVNDAAAGGAIYVEASSPILRECWFEGNTAANGGAVLFGAIASPTVHDCTFVRNSADPWSGGAIDSHGSWVQTHGSVFRENSAGTRGGAVSVRLGGTFTLNGAVFQGNTAAIGGGAVHVQGYSGVYFVDATLCENAAPSGGGLFAEGNANVTLQRSIVAFSQEGEAVACVAAATVWLHCCDVFGNLGGDWVGYVEPQGTTNGNFSADPVFCDPDAGDLHLQSTSPCLPEGNSCALLIGGLGPGCPAVNAGAVLESMSWSRLKGRHR